MSEFELWTINNKKQQCENKIAALKAAIAKVESNSEKLVVNSLEKVNRVALFEVEIKHTSEYFMKLGGAKDYFAEAKSKVVIEILQSRIASLEEQIKKWTALKDKIEEKQRRQQMISKGFEIEHGKNGIEAVMHPIGENDDGQQIFNIVEYEKMQGSSIEQLPPISIQGPLDSSHEKMAPKQPAENSGALQPEPQRMSKFKMERMKMKQDKS